MRKFVKKQLLDIVTTLLEAQQLMEVAIAGGDNLTNLLADQQDAAIAIGNQIEEAEETGTAAVQLLEQYCETLWQMSQTEDEALLREQKNKVCELLLQIKEQIEKLPNQYDVVFLPYKASMWDCMESVWQAACEDDSYYPIVMPIPYFDIKDGQVTERHYEGDKFPSYVPITDYRNLNLEELQPDIIFVHNAFDSYNKVTSVLPQFYSDRLKAVTKKLIYIPYFVTGEAVYVTHRYLPAYDNMDFIVTQCEKMIDSYADRIPRDKFLPFGSPIADRIIKLEKKKPPIPEEWKRMLPNGVDFGENRVVMLNTSISLLMKEKERFLNKIEYLFDVVKRMSGILLIWRPHPLLRTSAATLGEAFVERLDSLEKKFLDEQIGVLDKTPDVGVTVALCDAYLGETASSLIHMFGIAGKPRFYINLQVPRIQETKSDIEYTVSGYCKDGEREYFLLDEPGWIVTRNIETGEVLPFLNIPDRENIRGRAYLGMEMRENKLFLYPDHALGILIYNMQTGSMKKMFESSASPVVLVGSYDKTTLSLATDSECVALMKAKQFVKGNPNHEWYESDKNYVEDYFRFLITNEKEQLAGYLGAYPIWLASLDGSCGRKVLQAVEKSLNEE